MPLDFCAEGRSLVWVRNPFWGTVTYFTDVTRKGNAFRRSTQNSDPAVSIVSRSVAVTESVLIDGPIVTDCPFCPGNEARSADEVCRRTPREVFGQGSREDWLIRAVRNLVPRIPERCTGGKNESYVVVEDPRHFFQRERDHGRWTLLHSSALPVVQFQALLEVDREVARLAYENPSVRHVLIRKNQGPESGASQPHVHNQVIGSNETFPSVARERDVTAREPSIWWDVLQFARRFGFVLRERGECVLYFCPFGTFPRSYEVVCLKTWQRLVEVPQTVWADFALLLHEGLNILGPVPLDYEIHDGPGVPLHAHIHARHYPYSSIGGTLNLPLEAQMEESFSQPPRGFP